MRTLLLLPLLVAAGCDGGHSSPYDGVVDAQIRAMDDLAEVVGGIRTPRGVEVWRPAIEGMASRMEEARTAALGLGEPSPAEKKRIEDEIDVVSKRLQARIDEAADALRDDPLAMVTLIALTTDVTSKRVRWPLR